MKEKTNSLLLLGLVGIVRVLDDFSYDFMFENIEWENQEYS